ncbi:MAG: nucleotidyl transferase AbiEii/AbiGii toxin family protein [Bacillota bacterium]|nr:nucleotidyl transferase AbiEii/AbiGii toxin family protein [Bacillota bacterium]
MTEKLSNLIHDKNCFKRETLETRMQLVGVKNIARMELFLWDLEIFLQLQKILGEKLVLKGGAAVQFYLPVHEQRTSVDIDMLFHGSFDEIQKALSSVEAKFPHDNDLFIFRQHKPERPKTKLPLYTYYMQVPSVCTQREIRDSDKGQQRIKIEFIICNDRFPITQVLGNNVFAMESQAFYQILPIDHLIADKLTTLGPNTIGIQDERMDEQVKQLYDINSLLSYHYQSINLDVIRQQYHMRAHAEANDRGISFDLSEIKSDTMTQLQRLRNLDDGSMKSKQYWQYILNFISLYASRSAIRTSVEWVLTGEKLRLFMMILYETNGDLTKFMQAQGIDRRLQFDNLSGVEKGRQIASFREEFILKYGHLTGMDTKILKGKRINRIYWAAVNLDNLDEIDNFVNNSINPS